MRLALTLLLVAAPAIALAQETAPKPLTPAEAAKKLEMKVTVEFEVKSTGGNNNNYLNSQADYQDAANFTIFIPKVALTKFAAAKIEKPVDYYKGKTIQVTGTVVLFEKKPQIRVEDPAQIKVVEKK
jgi:DNA/RNA endonuclease YhcR with UshA esterase domain